MDSFNAWDILVSVDPNVLNPQSLSIADNLLGSAGINELVNCVNGGNGIPTNTPGNIGCGINDGPGTVHSAVSSTSSSPQGAGGLLFSITYQAVGGTFSTVDPVKDQIVDAGSPVAHTTTRAVYGNPGGAFPTAEFTWTPSQPQQGQAVMFNASLTHDDPSNQPSGIVSYSWDFGEPLNSQVTTTSQTIGHIFTDFFNYVGGNFTVTLVVKNALGLTSQGTSHTVEVRNVSPPLQEFLMSFAYPFNNNIPAGSSTTTTISLVRSSSPITVRLNESVTPATVNGPTATLTPDYLVPNQPNSNSSLKVSTFSATQPGVYKVTVTGTNGRSTQSISFNLIVTPFSITTKPGSLTLSDGTSAKLDVTVGSISGFAGNMTLFASVDAGCLGCTVTPISSSFALSPNGIAKSKLIVAVGPHAPAYSYRVTLVTTSQSPFFFSVSRVVLDVPLLEPVFQPKEILRAHQISLSVNPTQTWTAIVTNPNGGNFLAVRILIAAVSGSSSFTAESSPIILGPGETRLNITISHLLTSLDAGLRYSFTATILWDLSLASLGRVSSSTASGFFTIALRP